VIISHVIRAFAELFHMVFVFCIIIIFVRSIISWVGNIPPNAFIFTLRRLTDPVFRWVHRKLPFTIIGGIDISPLIILAALYFLDTVIYGSLLDIANSLSMPRY